MNVQTNPENHHMNWVFVIVSYLPHCRLLDPVDIYVYLAMSEQSPSNHPLQLDAMEYGLYNP